MRDPKRIPKILKALEEIWVEHPDLRLAQLIGNLQTCFGDLYHLEDKELIEMLKRLYNAGERS